MTDLRAISRGFGRGGVGLILALLLLVAPHALAGGRLPCEQARVFGAAAVNALVLPYRYSEGWHNETTSIGGRLSALIQQETLFALLKYGSVGVTELVGRDEACDVRQVLNRVTQRGGDDGLRRGHGLVIIWGRIYEEEKDLYVQSYIRFLRHGEPETILVDLAGPGDNRLQLEASLPQQAVAMPPRALTKEDVKEIEASARHTLVVRPAPDEMAEGSPLSGYPYEPLTYGVVDVRGDWMKIRSFVTSEEGWVRARIDNENWALRRFLPELGYLDGVAGYLRLRASDQVPLTDPKRVHMSMERAFADYEAAVGPSSPEASGLARAMRGVELWTRPSPDGDVRREAARLCQEAFERLPESSDARVLATVIAARSGHPIDKISARRLNGGLLGAVALDPQNLSALRNLERLYEFAGRNGLGLYEPGELQSRLALVKAAREKLERR